MIKAIRWFKKHGRFFFGVLIVSSLLLVVADLTHMAQVQPYFQQVAWVGVLLIISEILFVLGVILMMIGAGESLAEASKSQPLYKRLYYIRKNYRRLGEAAIVNNIFTIGFWMNFLGAVASSIILIVVIIVYTPITGSGILLILIIDLVATFGWRIPVELARRRIKRSVS